MERLIYLEKFLESNSRWKPYYDQHSVGHISKTKINSISFSNVYVSQYIFLISRSRELSHTLITELTRTRFHHIPRYRFSFYSLWVIDLKPKYYNKSAKCWSACKKKLFNSPFANGVILLLRSEFFSFFFSYLNLEAPVRFK